MLYKISYMKLWTEPNLRICVCCVGKYSLRDVVSPLCRLVEDTYWWYTLLFYCPGVAMETNFSPEGQSGEGTVMFTLACVPLG